MLACPGTMRAISGIVQIVSIGAVMKINTYRGKGMPSRLETLHRDVSLKSIITY